MVMVIDKQQGAVSLFVVVFAAMLIMVVTVSFITSMLSDQQMASTTDLSQSAYDSARAGEEDAKRAILRYQTLCANDPNPDCAQRANININSGICNEAVSKLNGVVDADNEVKIVQQDGDKKLDQAYTCVKINLNTDDYLGALEPDSRKLIPMAGVGEFDTIQIEWFAFKDLAGVDKKVDVPTVGSGTVLVSQSEWTTSSAPNRPPIMRAQFMQVDNTGFTLSDLDSDVSQRSSNATNNSLFLYPVLDPDGTANPMFAFASDGISSNSATFEGNNPLMLNKLVPFEKNISQAYCKSNLNSEMYACSAKIKLPAVIKRGERTAYLNLAALYKKTNYRITLFNGSSPIKFEAVQPEIDSTGRANDLLRRVKSRVELTDINFPYPDMAVDLSGNLCKDFIITDDENDYSGLNNNACKP
jgi:hypothetical protein